VCFSYHWKEQGHKEYEKMVLHLAGNFRELDDGTPSDPSIQESRDKVPQELRPLAAQYLRRGYIIFASGGMAVDDWFDGTRGIGSRDVRTDGIWLWPDYFAHYVEKYGVDVPQEFLDHMARQGWIAPELTEAKVREVLEQFYKQFGGPNG
jgi:hypothetical protein